MKKVFGNFRDSLVFDSKEKTAISVRDGVLEYYGQEIGYEPADKIFKVYRSPATIANAAALMINIPLTNDHVDVNQPVPDDRKKGTVLTSKMIDLNDPETQARIGVLNKIDVAGDQLIFLQTGKKELSLGYGAVLIPAPEGSNFDLEQIEIVPHHLATVDAGRCGSVCSFIDHAKGNETMSKKTAKAKPLNKAFTDAEGKPSMTEIVAIVQSLPDALAALPADELMKVMPTLQEIVNTSKGKEPAPDSVEAEEESSEETAEDEAADEGAEEQTAEDEAAEGDDKDKDKKTPVTDSKEFKDAVAAGIKSANATYIAVVDKARQFLPETFSFADKTANDIMRAALATEYGKQKFTDGELDVAFKMLKKTKSQHQKFGDGAATKGKFTALADKSI